MTLRVCFENQFTWIKLNKKNQIKEIPIGSITSLSEDDLIYDCSEITSLESIS